MLPGSILCVVAATVLLGCHSQAPATGACPPHTNAVQTAHGNEVCYDPRNLRDMHDCFTVARQAGDCLRGLSSADANHMMDRIERLADSEQR